MDETTQKRLAELAARSRQRNGTLLERAAAFIDGLGLTLPIDLEETQLTDAGQEEDDASLDSQPHR